MTETMEFDVLIVGAGPAGLSAAIRLKQLAEAQAKEIEVAVVEKGSEVGAHILSGCVLEPRALNELLPNWEELGAPLKVEAKQDTFLLLSETGATKLPTPPQMKNHGNYIISLANFTRWLGEQAEALGVQIYPGFPAADILYNEDGSVAGVLTGEFGIGKDSEKKDSYQPAMELRANYTLFGEGCRGSLTKRLEQKLGLREKADPQTYGIGLKEIWEIPVEQHQEGEVLHTVGWPMDKKTYGGSFLYHMEDHQVAIGFVIGLDYQNTYLNPFKEFQRFKHHPKIAAILQGGKRLSYGARALNEGGWQSIPTLGFTGGALIGCAAGFLNVPKIKGTHTAMKSGMLAAEAIMEAMESDSRDLSGLSERVKNSWIGKELYKVRNIRPAFAKGMWFGLGYAALDTYLFRGKAPWTFHHHADHAQLKPAKECTKIDYPQPDGALSFDLLSSVFLSNTNHEEDQPAHLKLKQSELWKPVNYERYDSPESRYCPAGVYEAVEEKGEWRLQINAQNCVHCKTCDIKDPEQNINWVTPEGGGGPNYPNM